MGVVESHGSDEQERTVGGVGCVGVDGFDEQERRNVEWCWCGWNVEWVER